MTQVRLPYALRAYQRAAWDALRRFSVLVWHRRGGKTVFAIKRCVTAALNTKQKAARYGYVAPYYRQAKEIAWTYLREMLSPVPGVKFHESELRAELPNGARIQLYGADNPDALRGVYWDGIVLDEVADMRPQVWGEIVRPALTDRQGWALFIGTPKGVNLFSDLYYRAAKGDEAEWYGEIRRAGETGALSADELAKAKREMSPSQWAQEMECDFAAAVDNILIPLQLVLDAQARRIPEDLYRHDPLVLGVDVARYGDDRSVATFRQGLHAYPPNVWRGLGLMELAASVSDLINARHPVATFVDQGGLGAGVVDRLWQLGHSTVIGVDFGGKPYETNAAVPDAVQFLNRKAQMWWLTAQWLKAGGALPPDSAYAAELPAPTYSHGNAAGKLQIESKESLKARGLPSPDVAESLVLTFAEPVAAPGLMRTLAGGGRSIKVHGLLQGRGR